jgi:glyoxylase-like metal-dependent hydrolase (beta-lactamase superfamily II)
MKITERIHALKISFEIPLESGAKLERFVTVYLLLGDEEIALVDAGVAGCEKTIFEYIEGLGRTPEEIGLLLQTHSHPDHMGATRAIKEATGCKVAAHGAAKLWIEKPRRQVRERPVPGFDELVGGPARVDRTLKDGHEIALDPMTIRVLYTPGHSLGAVALFVKSEGALFTGDTVLPPGSPPVYEDPETLATSIEKLRQVRGVSVLLSSRDAPRQGPGVARAFEESLAYLKRIGEVVRETAEETGSQDPLALCPRVCEKLGLPPEANTPLVASSLAGHLEFPRAQTRTEAMLWGFAWGGLILAALGGLGAVGPRAGWGGLLVAAACFFAVFARG